MISIFYWHNILTHKNDYYYTIIVLISRNTKSNTLINCEHSKN